MISKTTQKYIYIIRHGETEYNRLNIVQGSGIDMELNEAGHRQAQHFFEHYRDFPFDKIYTSALKRSQQSVQSFIDKGIPWEQLPELNEIGWGDIEGKEQTPEHKALYWEVVGRWNAGEFDASISNGESPLQMQERQKRAADYILGKPHEKNVLICMHGRALKSFLCLLLDVSLANMEEFQHTNLGLYLLEHDGERFELLKRNDVEHLR